MTPQCKQKSNYEVVVSSTEPIGANRKKVWIQNTDTEQKIYLKNDDNMYEEFVNNKTIILTKLEEQNENVDVLDLNISKYGKVVTVNSVIKRNIDFSGQIEVGKIPKNFAPSNWIKSTAIICANIWTTLGLGRTAINPDTGTLYIQNNLNINGNYAYINFSYIQD